MVADRFDDTAEIFLRISMDKKGVEIGDAFLSATCQVQCDQRPIENVLDVVKEGPAAAEATVMSKNHRAAESDVANDVSVVEAAREHSTRKQRRERTCEDVGEVTILADTGTV